LDSELLELSGAQCFGILAEQTPEVFGEGQALLGARRVGMA
jgi:hypothetical protein